MFLICHHNVPKMIQNDPKRADDVVENQTKNEWILFISFLVKLIELITLIFTFSYFFSCLWIILCEFVEDFVLDTDFVLENNIFNTD